MSDWTPDLQELVRVTDDNRTYVSMADAKRLLDELKRVRQERDDFREQYDLLTACTGEANCNCYQHLKDELKRLRQLVTTQQSESEHDMDNIAEVLEENRLLRSQLHTVRGLLETACDAYECGDWNSLIYCQICGLTQEWYDQASKLTKEKP